MAKKIIVLFYFGFMLSALCMKAQTFALKTNTLYWATASLNIEPEVKLAKKSTLTLGISWNPWTFKEDTKNRKWKHLLVQPEYRYWFCNAFSGHFLGLHPFYARVNIGNLPLGGLKENRYQGNLAGAGIGYGYHWILGNRWSIEAEVGLGAAYFHYDYYSCERCGTKKGTDSKVRFVPTKLSVSFVYFIR